MGYTECMNKSLKKQNKIDHEQNYSNFEEGGNKGPLSAETEQPCIAADKLPCVKQEQASNLTGGSRNSSANLGKVMAKYEASKTRAKYAEISAKIIKEKSTNRRRNYRNYKVSQKKRKN